MSITRITSKVLEDEFFQGAFANDPDTTTATEWGYEAGYAAGTADIELVGASTVSYTAPAYIYVDWNKAVPTIASVGTGDSLPADGILLYEVRSATDFTDYRTWSSSSYSALQLPTMVQQTTNVATADSFTSGAVVLNMFDPNNTFVSRAYTFFIMLRDPTVQVDLLGWGGSSSSGSTNNFTPAQRRAIRGVTDTFAYEVWIFRDEDAVVPVFQAPSAQLTRFDLTLSGETDYAILGQMTNNTVADIIALDRVKEMYITEDTIGTFDGADTYDVGATTGNQPSTSVTQGVIFMKGIDANASIVIGSTRTPYSDWLSANAFNTGPTQADNMLVKLCVIVGGTPDTSADNQTLELTGTPGSGDLAYVDVQFVTTAVD